MMNPLYLEDSSTDSSSSSSDDLLNPGSLMGLVANYVMSFDIRDIASSSKTHLKREDCGKSHDRLVRDYFGDDPKFDVYFRERFQMDRKLFLKIVGYMEENFEFFQTKYDARYKKSFSGLQKCTSAIRQLGYRHVPDSIDEYLNLSERTSRDSLHAFCSGVIKLYGKNYFRRPTRNDVQILYEHHASRHSFFGMLGSVDCTYWAWRSCLMAWRGQFKKGDHPWPTIMLEVAASQDAWFCHAYFDITGSNNNLDVLNQSPLFNVHLNKIVIYFWPYLEEDSCYHSFNGFGL